MKSLIFLLALTRFASGQLYFPFVTLFEGQDCQVDGGAKGVCKKAHDCQQVVQQYFMFRSRPVICSFDAFTPVICCPNANNNNNNNGNTKPSQPTPTPQIPTSSTTKKVPLTPSSTTKLPQLNERVSIRKCKDYIKCNALQRVAIVGGEDANVGEFPHMAVLGWPLIDGKGFSWSCGGTLISENFVLTAAHCMLSKDTSVSSETPTVVRVGEHHLKSDNDGANPQDVPIESIIMHPEYKPPSKYNDIALLKLSKPVKFTDQVRPACLWQTKNLPTDNSLATGWGKLGHQEGASDILQKVFLKIIDNESCKSTYQAKRYLKNGIIEEQLCAGDPNGGKDTCQGDSGGPLQLQDTKYTCSYHIVGITSFGIGCGGKNTPAVYTRVSSYIDWIEKIVWP